MIGLLVMAAGFVLAVCGVVVTFGLWTLIPTGVVLLVAGLLVDFDRVKEPRRAKRDKSAS